MDQVLDLPYFVFLRRNVSRTAGGKKATEQGDPFRIPTPKNL